MVCALLLGACGSDAGSATGDAGSVDIGEPGGIDPADSVSGDGVVGSDGGGSDTSAPIADAGPCPQGAVCDDGDPCTKDDRCANGACVGLPYTCDDGRACTVDACDGLGGCGATVAEGACLIGNQCYADGDQQGCGECRPGESQTVWSPIGEDEPCDDGDACTQGDHCEGAVCTGGALVCDDGSLCTSDACDPATGCVHAAVAASCDDGDACTTGDLCLDGACVGGSPVNCNDDNPCTDDTCAAASGCSNAPHIGDCTDGDACTLGDTCEAGACIGGPQNPCDDDNPCTVDSCDAGGGCVHVPAEDPCCQGGKGICDDDDPCTVDLCDPESGACAYEPNLGFCNDGDPCTSGDTCTDGVCKGSPKSCDDGNPCTEDACVGFGKCVATPTSGAPCDDGKECSTGDVCVAGQCKGDTTACVCQPEFSDTVSKISALAIGKDGKPGQGLDVDANAATCAPSGQCADGIDNSLSVVASFANNALGDAVTKGSILLLLEHADVKTDGTPYDIHFFTAKTATEGCDFQTQSCPYTVSASAFDDDCNALISFPGATIKGGVLTAGGPGTSFPFEIPISGLPLQITIYSARIQAEVTLTDGTITGLQGIIGGAVPKEDIKAAVSALPAEQFPAGFSKETILNLLDVLVVNDIDSDGNGTKDAASIGIPFQAISGTIVGVQ
ncbi:MAG: hypothetical protein AMXMBFR64_61130 [Myxococcales bacterium]